MKDRSLSDQLNDKIGGKVTIAGWVSARRNHGKLIFIDVKDRRGIVQVVFVPDSQPYKLAQSIRPHWVISVNGEVVERPENMKNSSIASGNIELQAQAMAIISRAETPPFDIDETTSVNEEIRLKYRYIDLRSPRMQANLKIRSQMINAMRRWLLERDFIEIETPNLTRSTPEGARDYIVPSRLQPGTFYALPQSPQQYKQLLMISGFERYFQIARCFRDEDTRGDRQPEFTQLDIEMAFADEEDIINLMEELHINIVKLLFPDKKITTKPFPRLTYQAVMDRYQTDRPDLRKNKNNHDELAFAWVVNFPMFEWSPSEKKWASVHHPFTAPQDEYRDSFEKEPQKAIAKQYDLVLNGFEVGGGSIRITDPAIQARVFKFLGHNPQRVQEKFGHLLKAYRFGAPNHGGIAMGLDRFLTVLCHEPSIREVIAFPKTGDGRDILMDSPSAIDDHQLTELKLKIAK